MKLMDASFSEPPQGPLCKSPILLPDRLHYTLSPLHQSYDPNKHGNLYIDLINLPPDTPTEYHFTPTGETVSIPVFLYLPLMILKTFPSKERAEVEKYLSKGFEPVAPTPYCPGCEVCELIDWVFDTPRDYNCLSARLRQEPIRNIIALTREILVRLQPGPWVVSQCLFDMATKVVLLRDPLEPTWEGYKHPIVQSWRKDPSDHTLIERCHHVLEWTNAIRHLLHEDVKNMENKCSQITVGFVAECLITMLRRLVLEVQGGMGELFESGAFFLLAGARNSFLCELIKAVAGMFSRLLTKKAENSRLAMENIIFANSIPAFFPEKMPGSVVEHVMMNRSKWENCTCYFKCYTDGLCNYDENVEREWHRELPMPY